MASKNQFSLQQAILMMTIAADDARKLAEHYRDSGIGEFDILAALVSEVRKRRGDLVSIRFRSVVCRDWIS